MNEPRGVLAVAQAVRSGEISALEVTRAALARIKATDGALNCFTEVLEKRALSEAAAVDAKIARGEDPGPLAGVPFAAKNLFDIRGIPTLAGSIIRADAPPPERDADMVEALNNAGAVLTGALNMDEFAYGFVTENSHYGVTRNPHDRTRVAGGSSGGSAAAVAAGMVPLALGTDTNGSIRVPASFCGIFGLKPTYGRLSRRGAFLFSGSFDTVGPFARSAEDLAAVYDVLQDRACLPQMKQGIAGMRVAVAGGYFMDPGALQANEAVAAVASALGVDCMIELPEAARARAAAFVITASEGGLHHLADLRSRASQYDPNTRDRFLAGALVPAAWVSFAQRFRSWYREQMREVFRNIDVILAPATPTPAIGIGQSTITVNGVEMPARANIGVFTQPISFIGLPVVTVPIHSSGKLPIGVQLIGAPYREAELLRVAWELQNSGVASAPVANG